VQGEATVLIALAVILLVARLGGDVAVRLRQPAVLGELVFGVVLGNLSLSALERYKTDPSIDMLARLGVVLLLFQVGLQSTVGEMLSVGGWAFLVAAVGVAAPFLLGWLLGAWLLPDAGAYVHAFLGATLSATSVGITARVLADLGKAKTREARIILGAAAVDDVLGLLILAVLTAAITALDRGGRLPLRDIAVVAGKAGAFLVGAIALGVLLTRPLFRSAARLRSPEVLLGVGLAFGFFVAWLAGVIGLSPIVGAFVAGLVLEPRHSAAFVSRGEKSLDELLQPIVGFLSPVFFVVMGMRTDLRSFARPGVLGLALAMVIAAVAGKQLCSLAAGPGVDRLSIGIGMIPRGEVGLIFANVGLSLRVGGAPVIAESTFSAVVVMVIVTTLVTPPALKWSLSRT
jgi:Kef-type K+ transport system membrane component KefB